METKVLRGYISRILTMTDNGWGLAIFTNEENKKAQIKIKGSIKLIKPKVLYEITGVNEEHPKYGKSFSVISFKLAETNSRDKLINYLKSPVFKGIGQKTAVLIIDFYGDNALTKIKNDPESLYDIPNLEPKFARLIGDVVKNIENDNNLINTFFENDLKIEILNNLKLKIEDNDELINILKNNFFAYALEQKIKPFFEIDKIATHFGLDLISPERIAYWSAKITMDLSMNSGNNFILKIQLDREVKKQLKINDINIIESGYQYANDNKLLYFRDNRVYTAEAWNDENIIADSLYNLVNLKNEIDINKLDQLIKEIEFEIQTELKNKNFKYDDIQIDTLKNFALNNFLIVTGGPGTGKTTLIRGMYKLFEKLYKKNNIGIAAPTGRAAARIRESWFKLNAVTIHKILKADATDRFEINELNPLKYDLLIIDESSMIENHLFAQFIKSIGNVKKVVLVGDINQLPSVGYGNVFEDLIDSDQFKVIKLTKIYRQKEGNGIIDLAYAIQNNTFKDIDLNKLDNVKNLFGYSNQDSLKLLKDDFENKMELINKNPFNYQIICPMYAGMLGIENINTEIQYEFNQNIHDKNKLYDRGRYRYTIGDKIMYLKNDTNLDITNGETGIIEKIVLKNNSKTLDHAFVNFGEDKVKELFASNFEDVNLAYACSVHKTQGSEYKHTVFVIENSNNASWFLNKKLIYTAITRAKEELVLIGDENLFIKAINTPAPIRKTTLKEKIAYKFKV